MFGNGAPTYMHRTTVTQVSTLPDQCHRPRTFAVFVAGRGTALVVKTTSDVQIALSTSRISDMTSSASDLLQDRARILFSGTGFRLKLTTS